MAENSKTAPPGSVESSTWITAEVNFILSDRFGTNPSSSTEFLKDNILLFGSNLAASWIELNRNSLHKLVYFLLYSLTNDTNSFAVRRTKFEFMSIFCQIKHEHQCGSMAASRHDRCFGIWWRKKYFFTRIKGEELNKKSPRSYSYC